MRRFRAELDISTNEGYVLKSRMYEPETTRLPVCDTKVSPEYKELPSSEKTLFQAPMTLRSEVMSSGIKVFACIYLGY